MEAFPAPPGGHICRGGKGHFAPDDYMVGSPPSSEPTPPLYDSLTGK
jgi:hypothetical protein